MYVWWHRLSTIAETKVRRKNEITKIILQAFNLHQTKNSNLQSGTNKNGGDMENRIEKLWQKEK